MPLSRYLPEFLQGDEDDEPATDATVIHECRHCGTDFEEYREDCPVCGAAEIATYEFGGEGASSAEDESASASESESESELEAESDE